MDAKVFWKEFGRMCTSNLCSECPAQDLYCSMTMAFNNNDTRIVDAVEKWSKEHPRKTRQSVFLEHWPNAKVDDTGVLCVYPCDVGHDHPNCTHCKGIYCSDCRRKFWMKEV